MLDGLYSIPWKRLTHAYGSAEDVPGLLHALQTASPELRGEDSPLWELFGNIWHQGTVYAATAYAVPFLIELAADPSTPDRVGILNLLDEIARGSSYIAVHRSVLDTSSFEEKKRREHYESIALVPGLTDCQLLPSEQSPCDREVLLFS